MRKWILAVLILLSVKSIQAATYYVNDNSTTGDVYTTAVGNNANPGTSTQPFATLTFALTVATGSDVIIIDVGTYSDKDLIISSAQSGITIKGASISSTIFDGTPHSGIYNFMSLSGNNIHIENLTITEYDNAGAIDIIAGSTLDSSRIYFKDVYFYRNETFVSFDANPQGGALWINASGANIPAAVYCDNCHFGDNLAEQGAGGGAIYITGKSSLIVKGSRFSCNNSRGILTTYEGGAIFFNQAHGKIRTSFFTGSKVIDQQGGAIRTLNNTATNYNLEIDKCTFTNNDGRQGAALYVEGKYTCNIINSLFYANNVTSGFGDGGTINCNSNSGSPTMSIVNSTIADNVVVSGSDGAGLSNEAATSYTVLNCIIWGNDNFNVNATATITASYSIIEPIGDMHSGATGNLTSNPLFTAAGNYTLQGTSPAINAGNTVGAPSLDLTSTARVANPDMGCFESGSTNPSTSTTCTLFLGCTNPVISSTAPTSSICTGTVFSTSLSSTPASATYVWSSPSVTGITGHSNTGTGNISETLVNSTSSPLNVVYTLTPFLSSCMGTQTQYTVTVNPVPTINSTDPSGTICSNTTFATTLTSTTSSGITTYAWTSTAVAGITGHSTSGTGNISETLVNTTNAALTVSYTITPSVGSCTGSSVTYNVVVNPTATITSSAPAASVCSNTLFSTSLTANTATGSTTYSWTSSAVTGITGHSTSGTGNISETLVNTSNAPLDVTYTITPVFGSCNGTPVSYTVTVNPTAIITSSSPVSSVCSNTLFSTSLSANTAAGSTTYSWTSSAVIGITGHSTSGTGNISETLVNTTNAPLDVTYTITPSFASCNGTPVSYTVTVNPTATITSVAPVSSICSSTLFSTSLTANTVAGSTSYSWSSSAVTGITGHSTSGTGNISETLVNTTNAPLNVSYTITPSFAGCVGTPVTYIVTVNPTPVINSTSPAAFICSGNTFTTALTSNTSAGSTSYAWTSTAVTGITGHFTSGNGDISETLTNTTTTPLNVTYTITPSFASCNGTSVSYTVLVDIVQLSLGADQEITCASPSVTLTATSTSSNVNFSWTDALSNPAGNTPGANSTDVVTAGIYTVTVTNPSTGCSATGNITVTTSSSLPDITMGADQELNCLTSSVAINGSTTILNPQYAWTDSNGDPAGNNPAVSSTEVMQPGVYTLTITNLDNGCSVSGTVTVTLNPDPIAAVDIADTLTCSVSNVQLDGSNSSNGSNFSYIWSGPSVVSGGTSAVAVIDVPGVYTLEVTDSNTGCIATANVNVIIDTISPIAIALSSSDINCANLQASLDGTSSTGNNLQYSWTGFGIVSGANTNTALVNQAGVFTLTVTDGNNGCSDAENVTVLLDTVVPAIIPMTDTSVLCGAYNILLSVSNIAGASYNWSGSGISGATNTSSVTVTGSGTYQVTVTGANGCSITDDINVSISGGPTAAFNLTPTTGQAPLLVTTDNQSIGNDLLYYWSFGNGDVSSAMDTSVIYLTGGNYDVILIVTDSVGCKDTARVTITINNSEIDIPNGFTPNGDGINDSFEIVGIEQYPDNKISIFNRWGELVYSAQPYMNDWIGQSNNTALRLTGDKVVDGTYYFVLDLGDGSDAINGYIEMKSR